MEATQYKDPVIKEEEERDSMSSPKQDSVVRPASGVTDVIKNWAGLEIN